MTDLDDAAIYARLDPSGMRRHIRELPQQFRDAWQRGYALPDSYRDVDNIVIMGMGGSAIGGDLAAALVADECPVPIIVRRDYGAPGFVDGVTLAIGASYSGGTEETLSAFTAALDRGARGLVITTGGRLADIARERRLPVFGIPYQSPPRAALGWGLAPLLGIFEALGFVGDLGGDVAEAIGLMEHLTAALGEDAPTVSNPAKQLAQRLCGRLPVIYGGGILEPVARRFKTQLNENAKSFAYFEVLPELNHNATVGFEFPTDPVARPFVVILDAEAVHPRLRLRAQITADFLSRAGVDHQVAAAEGECPLAQMMSLVLLGDWTSYYLAMLNGCDPYPVAIIDELKQRLS